MYTYVYMYIIIQQQQFAYAECNSKYTKPSLAFSAAFSNNLYLFFVNFFFKNLQTHIHTAFIICHFCFIQRKVCSGFAKNAIRNCIFSSDYRLHAARQISRYTHIPTHSFHYGKQFIYISKVVLLRSVRIFSH